jgi:hypothetical protein
MENETTPVTVNVTNQDNSKNSPLSDPKMTPKAGWKTTEFWITIGIQIMPWVESLQGRMKPEYAAIVSLGAQVFYAWSRSRAKSKQ